MPAEVSDAVLAAEITPGGHPPEAWARLVAAAPSWDPATVGGGPLLVLSAHPDDETIGFGRAVARWARLTGPVDLVSLTSGEACVDAVRGSTPGRLPDREQIGALRRAEFDRAGAALQVRSSRCLSLPDGALSGIAPRVVAAIDEAVRAVRPVLVAAPWTLDPHPDHAAVGRAATVVAADRGIPVVEYQIWASFWTPPPTDPAHARRLSQLPVDALDEVGRDRALACYPSQYSSFFPGLGPVVPDEMLGHHRRAFAFRPTEPEENS